MSDGSIFAALPDNERRVFDLEQARIDEIGFDPEAGVWNFSVSHRGCDDDAAVLTVARDAVEFVHPSEVGS